jgi:PAS domain S-box-containing protein
MPINDKIAKKIKQVGSLTNLPDIVIEPRFRVKVVSNLMITKEVLSLQISRPAEFNFLPGQYVWLVLPEHSKYLGIIDRRAYSIASGINETTIGLLVNTGESNFLKSVKSLKPNDEVDIIGPMGSSFIVPPSGAVMIAGGTGITPFLSILRSHASKNLCLIAYSRKDKESLHFEKELQEISEKYKYRIFLKKSGPQESDFEYLYSKKNNEPVFICGSQGFVDYISDILIGKGVSKTRLHYEENYPQTEDIKKLNEMFKSFYYGDWSNQTQQFTGISDVFLEALKQSSNYVVLTDHHGRILFANQAAIDTSGFEFSEMQGQTPRLWGGLMPKEFYQQGWSLIVRGDPIKRATINRRRDGSIYTAITTITPISHKGVFFATQENVTTLREVDKAKTEFVSIASHQLRTPLSIVRWYTEMLASGDAGRLSKKQSKYLQEIYTGNQRMVELVNSLLDASRLELGTFTFNPEKIDLAKSTKSLADEQKVDLNNKKIKLTFKFSKDIPDMQLDPKLLRMVVQNLLSNAIKYTPEKGKIEIGLSKYKNDDILLTVSDNGYGIPKEQQFKIFTKFFRADNVRLKSADGTGLGLYIVKSIIDKVGGEIWFNSEENKGTTFFITIPIITKGLEKEDLQK